MEDKINKIIQMDCLEYLRKIPSETVSAFISDEPYMLLKGHKIEEGYNLDIAKQVRIEAMRVLKKDGWFIFFGMFPSAWDFGRITMEAGFKPWQQCNEIVWCKRTPSWFIPKVLKIHENIFVFQKGSPQVYDNKAPYEDILVDNAFHGIASFESVKRYIAELKWQFANKTTRNNTASNKNNDVYFLEAKVCERSGDLAKISSVFSFASENKMHKNSHNIKHPTVKPTLLFRRLIKLFTQKGDTICDPFSGSGTTALASIQEGRNFLCCERDEGYVKIANDRLENWREDLLRQDKWLNDRGVTDFESDIKEQAKQEQTQGTLI